MAAKKDISLSDSMTVEIAEKQKGYEGPMVPIFLPRLEEEGNGMKVDQYEHVTIANEEKEWTWYVQRGVHIDVPAPVFVQLKAKYPDL